MISAGIYVRVSTQEQVKEGYSIGEQTERLTMYCTAHNWKIYKVYTDAGFSGSNMKRPSLQEMISDVEAKKINKVLVYKLDRLSRSQKDTLKIIEDILLPNNCDFESMTEKFDTSTSFGKAMLGILAVFAQLEREQIRERMSLGLNARVREGKWKGGNHVPFGYRYENQNLIINEFEAMIVKTIFDQFVSGKTIFSIQQDLIDKGFLFHNNKVDKAQINYILNNRTYTGYLKFQDQWFKGMHEPIIDIDTFNTAQNRLQSNLEEHRKNLSLSHNKSTALLSGLIYCAQCGSKYSKVRTGSKQSGYHDSYFCYSRHKKVKSMIRDPNCKNKFFRVEDLDTIILNEIKKLSVDPAYIDEISNRKNDHHKEISVIEAQISTINSQLSRFFDLYGTGIFNIEDLDLKTKPLLEQRAKLQETLERSKPSETIEKVSQILLSFEKVLEKGSAEDKRTIIRSLINRIEIDNDTIRIHWKFA